MIPRARANCPRFPPPLPGKAGPRDLRGPIACLLRERAPGPDQSRRTRTSPHGSARTGPAACPRRSPRSVPEPPGVLPTSPGGAPDRPHHPTPPLSRARQRRPGLRMLSWRRTGLPLSAAQMAQTAPALPTHPPPPYPFFTTTTPPWWSGPPCSGVWGSAGATPPPRPFAPLWLCAT